MGKVVFEGALALGMRLAGGDGRLVHGSLCRLVLVGHDDVLILVDVVVVNDLNCLEGKVRGAEND